MALLAEPLVDPITTWPHRVAGVMRETSDVVTLTLQPVDVPVSGTQPGQFVMCWAFGVGEIPISVSGVGHDGSVQLTVRSVGAVSDAIVNTQPGDLLGMRGPYGTAWPLREAAGSDVVVVAGGLGLAPLRMAIEQLAASSPASLTVVNGAREPQQLLYADDVQRWRTLGARVHQTVDAASRFWAGSVGTATALLDRLGGAYGTAFVCGPELMMTSAAAVAIAQGTDPSRIWVSLERNMHCGVAHCGRCQLGPLLLCRDGAVVPWGQVVEPLKARGR